MQIEHLSQFVKAQQPRQIVVYLMQNLRLRVLAPPIIFARIVRPINALQLCHWQFSHKETFKQNFFNRSAILSRMRPFLRFETPFGAVRDYVRCSSWAHWKARSGLLLVLIELFSLDVTVEALRVKIDRKSAISLQCGHFDLKFQVEVDIPTNNFCIDS